MHDHSPHFVVASEQIGGNFDLPAGKCSTDRGRTDGLSDPIWSRNESDRAHDEVVRFANLGEQRDVPRAFVTEVEILAHDHFAGTQVSDERALDERGRRFSGAVFVEAHDVDGIDPRRLQQLELLVEIGQQFRCRLRTHHGCGMTIEGDDDACATELQGPLAHLGDHCTVAKMHPVVGANGDDTAAIVVSWGSALRVTDDLHGASRYRFGKHDARLGRVSTVFVHRNETLVFIRNRPRTITVEERQ